jgi:hypothetical protein
MIYIDNNIRLAISSLKQICVTNDATGERLGVSGKHISQILKGEVESIRPSTWETMEPILRRFMPRHETQVQQDSAVHGDPGQPYGRGSSAPRNPELARLFQWLETDACPDQIAAVLATARAVGLPNGSPNSLPSGLPASPSAAKVA